MTLIPLNTPVVDDFVGDGTEQIIFPISFPTFEESNIEAQIITPSGGLVALQIETHYVLDSIGIPNTDATFTLQISSGFEWTDDYGLKDEYTLRIKFSTNAFQPAKLRDLGRFAPEVLEKVVDRLTMNMLALRQVVLETPEILEKLQEDLNDLQLELQTVSDKVDVLEGNVADIVDENIEQQDTLDDHETRITDIEGILQTEIVFKNSSFLSEYRKVFIVTGSGNINATLPAPQVGKSLYIKKLGTGDVTLVRNGSEKIDNIASNKILTSTKESATLISDGVDWFII